MSIIGLIVILVVLAFAGWAINALVPMEPRVKQVLNAAIVLIAVLVLLFFVLQVAGVTTGGHLRLS